MENDIQNSKETNLAGKELYEMKKAQKEKERGSYKEKKQESKIGKNFSKILLYSVIVGVFAGGIYYAINKNQPEGADLSKEIPLLSRDHIAIPSPRPKYNSNPPTSGPHYPETAKPGFRKEEILDMYLVHNLEHGQVWISYKPTISEAIKEQLQEFDGSELVIITPRAENDSDITVAAWGRLDVFDIKGEMPTEEELVRIKDFIIRYKNKGPEKIPPGQHGGVI